MDSDSTSRSLEGILEEHKIWLESDSAGQRANLRWYSFPHIDWAGVDLSGADLQAICLAFANLRGAKFDGALLQNATFYGADLTDCSFKGCNLEGAVFSRATIERVNFSDAYTVGAKFTGEVELSCGGEDNVTEW